MMLRASRNLVHTRVNRAPGMPMVIAKSAEMV